MSFENKTKVWVFGLVLLAFAASIGCDMKGKLDDMHDKTNAMAVDLKDSKDTAQGMSGKMDKTYTAIEDTRDTAQDTFHGMRPLLSLQNHETSYQLMLKDKSLGEKLSDAAAYYYTCQFQGFKGVRGDTHVTQEDLLALDAADFVEKAGSLLSPDSALNGEFFPMNSEIMNRLAFAATMSKTFPQQKIDAATNGFEVVSIYSMVVKALRSLKQNPYSTAAELRKDHEFLVNFREKVETLVGMMQARLNFLAIFVYGEIAGLEYETKVAGAFETLSLTNSWSFAGDQEISLYDKNLTQIEQYIYYLKSALRTKRALVEYGADATLNDTRWYLYIGSIYRKVNFDGRSWKSKDPHFAPLKSSIAQFNYFARALNMPWQDFLKIDQDLYKDDR